MISRINWSLLEKDTIDSSFKSQLKAKGKEVDKLNEQLKSIQKKLENDIMLQGLDITDLKDKLASIINERDQLKTQLEMERLKTSSVGSEITPAKRKPSDPLLRTDECYHSSF